MSGDLEECETAVTDELTEREPPARTETGDTTLRHAAHTQLFHLITENVMEQQDVVSSDNTVEKYRYVMNGSSRLL